MALEPVEALRTALADAGATRHEPLVARPAARQRFDGRRSGRPPHRSRPPRDARPRPPGRPRHRDEWQDDDDAASRGGARRTAGGRLVRIRGEHARGSRERARQLARRRARRLGGRRAVSGDRGAGPRPGRRRAAQPLPRPARPDERGPDGGGALAPRPRGSRHDRRGERRRPSRRLRRRPGPSGRMGRRRLPLARGCLPLPGVRLPHQLRTPEPRDGERDLALHVRFRPSGARRVRRRRGPPPR